MTKQENDQWLEGYDAGMAGANDLDNPYELGSDEGMSWEDGRFAFEVEDTQT